MRVSLLFATLVVLCAPAHAAAFRVEIAGGWEAEAVAAALRADLASEPAKLALRGELRGGILRYAIVRPGGAPVRGAIALAGLERAQLAGLLRDQLHRIVRPSTEPLHPPEAPEEVAAPAGLGGAVLALAALAGVLAIPIVLAGRRALALHGTRRLAIAIGGLAVLASIDLGLAVHAERVAGLGGWVFLAGGLAWGALAVVTLPVALPPLAGLHRVEAGELAGALAAWVVAAAARTLALAVLAAPIAIAVWLVGDALGVPRAIGFGVVAPLVALALRLAWRALVELLAVRLDARTLDETADAHAWHPQVRAYLVGYLRRANLTVDDELLARMRFLPGREADVAIYGGGLTHTRVVIPRAMLEHALAPYGRPHDYAMPRVSTLHWTHWNAGLVMPTEAGEHLATRDDRKPHETVDEGEHARIALGEPPTLSGVIEPRAFDPRTSYRPTEDPLFLDWDPGEEHDGTDAGDKDYLFGLLVHALGVVQRREDGASVLGWVRRWQARRGSAIGDVAIALGGARHHFAQYLAWLAWRRDDLVTARAYVPVLEQTSRRIVAALAGAKAPRLQRVVPLLAHTGDARPPRRRLALAVVAVIGLGAVTTLVVQAVLYHSTYEARIKAAHERLDDGKRN